MNPLEGYHWLSIMITIFLFFTGLVTSKDSKRFSETLIYLAILTPFTVMAIDAKKYALGYEFYVNVFLIAVVILAMINDLRKNTVV